MGIPHYTITDTSLAGYHIPKNTIVFPNLEALHLDPKCWENPEEFNPHRHIDADGKLITDQGNWLPFGAGRRGCPGESFPKIGDYIIFNHHVAELLVSTGRRSGDSAFERKVWVNDVMKDLRG